MIYYIVGLFTGIIFKPEHYLNYWSEFELLVWKCSITISVSVNSYFPYKYYCYVYLEEDSGKSLLSIPESKIIDFRFHGLDKYAMLTIKQGKMVKYKGVKMAYGNIKILDEDDQYNYLAILQANIKHTEIKKRG